MLKREVGRLFPNLNKTVAYYSPTTFFITLNTISENDYLQLANSEKLDKKGSEAISTVFHEMQHHIDHISTLWGQKSILLLGQAIDARLSQDETQFQKIIIHKLKERQLHYAKYYTEEYNIVPWTKDQGNWRYSFTSGVKFNHEGKPLVDKPIVFLRFATSTGVPLTRVPLSIASLLETNALHAENNVRLAYLSSLPDGEKVVENAILGQTIMSDIIYNQKMALYNVAVHLTANVLEITDTADAFILSSSLATIALNLPEEHALSIPIPKEHAEWGDKCNHLLSNGDYGYIFLCLLVNYRPFFLNDQKEYSVDRVLIANNLPSKHDLETVIIGHMQSFRTELEKCKNVGENLSSIINQGISFFEHRGIDGKQKTITELASDHGYKSWIIFNDTDFDTPYSDLRNIFSSLPIVNLNPYEWYNFAEAMDIKMDEFFEIRGL